jgi:dephospho-CoA kinase
LQAALAVLSFEQMPGTDAARVRQLMRYVISLTGGIASGKSSAAQAFTHSGVAVFDADVIARELVRPGSEALLEIADGFGEQMLTKAGELDRQAMRERVFANAEDRRRLEAILHPRVRAALLAAVEGCETPYCLLVVPLLVENRADYAFADRVLVVDISPNVQIARLRLRDRSTQDDAARVIAAQAPRAERLAMADDVVDNDGDIAALEPAIERLHAMYLRLAAGKGRLPGTQEARHPGESRDPS